MRVVDGTCPSPTTCRRPGGSAARRVTGDDLGRLPSGDPPLPAGWAAARTRAGGVHQERRRRPLRRGPQPPGRGRHVAPVGVPALRHVHRAADRAGARAAGAPVEGARGLLAPGLLARVLPPPPRPPPARCCGRRCAPSSAASAGRTTTRASRPGPAARPASRSFDAGMRQLAQDRVDPQPRPDGGGVVPGEGPARRLAPRRDGLHAGPGGRRPGQQQRRLAVGGGHGDRRRPLLPGAEPGAPEPRFDPDGDYIRRYVPELRDVPGRPHPRALADGRRGAARGRVPHRSRLPGPASWITRSAASCTLDRYAKARGADPAAGATPPARGRPAGAACRAAPRGGPRASRRPGGSRRRRRPPGRARTARR